jgi:hypothetical protein
MNTIENGFWAQSLDYVSPDLIWVNEVPITEKDELQREALVTHVSDVSVRGSKVFSSRSVRIYLHHDRVVIDITTSTEDADHRKAGVVYLVVLPKNDFAFWMEGVLERISNFAKESQREIPTDLLDTIRAGLLALKGKRLTISTAQLLQQLDQVSFLAGVALGAAGGFSLARWFLR